MSSPANSGLTWDIIWEALYWQGEQPTPAQAAIVQAFVGGRRRLLIAGGERAGKSRIAAHLVGLKLGPETLDESEWSAAKSRRFWLVGPTYMASRAEFQYIYDALRDGGFLAEASMPQSPNQPWQLRTRWGVTVETKTSMDITKLASFSVHGALMCEAGAQDYDVVPKLYGRVSETKGFVILAGTFEDNFPWYEAVWNKWQGPNPEEGQSFSLPSWSNTAVYPGGESNPELVLLKGSVTAEWYARRYAAKPTKPQNLVIPEFDYGVHVRDLEPVAGVPVQLAIDPGTNAYAVLFVQHVGAYTYVLDAVYMRGEIAQVVIPEVMRNPLWRLVDKTPATSVIDIAGTQQHANKSQVQLWQEIAGLRLGSRYCHMRDTIDVVRNRLLTDAVLGEPLILFNSSLRTGIAPDGTASQFLSEFSLWKWPKGQPEANAKLVPIDNNNHGIKALGYKLIGYYGLQRERQPSMNRRVRKHGFQRSDEQVVAQRVSKVYHMRNRINWGAANSRS